jgi:DUF438 domain-containing protein
MSELINININRLNGLYDFARRLTDGENGKMLIETYKPLIDSVTPAEAMQVLDRLILEGGFEIGKVKSNTGKIINVFYKSLREFEWDKPGEGHFLYYLMQENREVEKIISGIRSSIKSILNDSESNHKESFSNLSRFIQKIKDYELHYIKKENILFPYLEKRFSRHRCLQLMWSFHDDYRRSVKALENILASYPPEKDKLNTELGRLFFVLFPIIFREEQIVFPVALKAVPEKDWMEMLDQSMETGWCYGISPDYQKLEEVSDEINGLINLDTGFLKPEEIILMFNNLPVDITYVDENDQVRYFSGTKDRIFPRSKAIIGRKVQYCHPPESVHVVNEIIESFRHGGKKHADFWVQIKGRFIYIRYFALYGEKGEYKGVIEVSQDVTEIRILEGEQRLLDWSVQIK